MYQKNTNVRFQSYLATATMWISQSVASLMCNQACTPDSQKTQTFLERGKGLTKPT